jgi:HEPN domain-containing protein
MDQFEIEQEIAVLENILSDLERLKGEYSDSMYFACYADHYDDDITEIKAKLEELQEIENNYWAREMRALNVEFERSVL